MIDRTLSHYTIVEKIGEGGMGEVYRAKDTRLGRDVAIKVLPERVASAPDRLARFEREARAVAGLNHPNIVTLYSIEEKEGVRFLTMELVEGENLDHLVTEGGLPLPRVLEISVQLAEALVTAHERGVVHRDLKPGNVMVTAGERVKVLDFGLAKLAQSDEELNLTQAETMESPISTLGQPLGTVPYMSPEQIRGESVDARADLFALGVIMYELVTGSRPFAGDSSADVSSAILRDTPEPISKTRTDLPGDLERIVGRCLEKDRDRRFQTAKDIRNELELLQRGPVTETSMALPAARKTVSAEEAPSIAVLPFANRSRSEDDEYFSDGLADELQSVLAKIRGLRVAARTSSATFKGKQATIQEVGEALGVITVLEGSVRKAGDRVRIAVQLVKVSDGYPMWSETYDRTLDDIFAVQDDIAQSVVKELRAALLGEAADSDASREAREAVAVAAKGRGENAEAHRLYLQGKHFTDRLNEQDVARGIELLQQAVELDPEHAPAWVALSQAYTSQAGWGWAPVFEGIKHARAAADRAIALAPDLADGYVTLCEIQRMYDWDWRGAEASARRAIELAPDSPDALREAGVLAGQIGRYEEAVALLERAVKQDPLVSRSYSQLGYAYRGMGRYPEAKAAYRKSLDIAPQRITSHHMIAAILIAEGRLDEAQFEAELEPAGWARLTALAYVHHAAGRKKESDEALARLEEDHGLECALQIAAIRSVRGETDAAFVWLDRAYAQRDAGLAQVQSEPTFNALHDDPRWGELLKKMGFEV